MRSLNLPHVFSSYVFDISSTRFRNAMTLAGISYSTECTLGKRCRDEEDEDKENREEIEPSCKQQCMRPISVGSLAWL